REEPRMTGTIGRRLRATLAVLLLLTLSGLALPAQAPVAQAQAAGLAVVSATPNGPNAPISAQIRIRFTQPTNPPASSGSINGAPLVPPERVDNPGNTVVDVDPRVPAYARTYTVTVIPTVAAAAGGTLGAPFTFAFAVATGPASKRPTSTVTLPGGP